MPDPLEFWPERNPASVGPQGAIAVAGRLRLWFNGTPPGHGVARLGMDGKARPGAARVPTAPQTADGSPRRPFCVRTLASGAWTPPSTPSTPAAPFRRAT